MRPFAILLVLLGACVLFWAMWAFVEGSQHMGSVIRLNEGFVTRPGHADPARLDAILLVVSAGKLGFELLDRALALLATSGVALVAAGIILWRAPFSSRASRDT